MGSSLEVQEKKQAYCRAVLLLLALRLWENKASSTYGWQTSVKPMEDHSPP